MHQYYIQKFLHENTDSLLNNIEATKFLGLSKWKFEKEVLNGKIPFYKKNKRVNLYHVVDLNQWLQNRKLETAREICSNRKNDVVEYGTTPSGMQYVIRNGSKTYLGALHKSVGFPGF